MKLPVLLLSTVLWAGFASAAVLVPVVPVQGAGAGAGFEVEGVMQAVKQSTLAAQVQGNVLVLAVKAGERVKAGQAVARFDAREPQAGVDRAAAGVAQAEAEFRNAQVNAQRSRDLRAQGFVAQAAVDQAETQLKAAQAGLAQAQAQRTQAGLAREFTTLVAPFDGVVLATHVEAGELAAPGRPIATLYAPGAMRAVVQVSASRAAAARAATQIEVVLPDGRSVRPRSVQALPGADPIAQTVEWRLDLADAGSALPGQTVRVRFAGASGAPSAGTATAALRVPASAVLRRGELTAVYVAHEGGFVLRAVRLGQASAQEVEVLAGLKSGERVAQDAIKAGLADARPAP